MHRMLYSPDECCKKKWPSAKSRESWGKSTKKVLSGGRKLPNITIYQPYVVRNAFDGAPSEVEPNIPACRAAADAGKAIAVRERSCHLYRPSDVSRIGNPGAADPAGQVPPSHMV